MGSKKQPRWSPGDERRLRRKLGALQAHQEETRKQLLQHDHTRAVEVRTRIEMRVLRDARAYAPIGQGRRRGGHTRAEQRRREAEALLQRIETLKQKSAQSDYPLSDRAAARAMLSHAGQPTDQAAIDAVIRRLSRARAKISGR